MRRLIILRGLPGAGKSSLVAARFPTAVVCSADDFFIDEAGTYRFDEGRLGAAHARCVRRAIDAMAAGAPEVVVDNTHSRRWEWEVVAAAGRALNYTMDIIDIFDDGLSDEALAARNRHGVPSAHIAEMRARWESTPLANLPHPTEAATMGAARSVEASAATAEGEESQDAHRGGGR